MVLSTAAAYQLWAPHYDTDPNPLLALEERIVRALVPDVESQTVVDVGCGTGRSMLRYCERGAVTFGVDPCLEMLVEAQRKTGIGRGLVLAEASHLPFANEIADLTLCSFALSYFQDLTGSLNELWRITKPTGRIIISDLHPEATARGWTRSFRVGTKTYEIAHRVDRDEHILSACRTAGLEIVTHTEAGFSAPERSIFVAAGKEDVYPTLMGKPAVRVVVCRKV
jgi:SAM-dependent methyltransferase